MMDKAGIQIIADTLSTSIEDVMKVMPRAERSALSKAASVLKKHIRNSMNNAMSAARKRSPKYTDRLIDAIRSTKFKDGAITVHIMGTRKTGSGTFRTRFFEKGTKDRYAKTYKGKPLKKPRYLGKIKPLRFFAQAVSSSKTEVSDTIQNQLDKYIRQAWRNE